VDHLPPHSVVVSMLAAGVVAMELVVLAAVCIPYIAGGETRLPALVTSLMSLGVAVGIFTFISGALRQRPDARASAVGWSVPVAAALGVLAIIVGLFALLLGARPAAAPLLTFVLAVVLPIGTIGVALLRPSARAWFERDERRRSRRP
jgi:hypothetical protein